MDRPAAQALAHQVHDVHNVGAAIASGSFQCHAMVVAPCPCARWRPLRMAWPTTC
jgi:3-polyprenyl-4-hydroxybenzoate decarboxylase